MSGEIAKIGKCRRGAVGERTGSGSRAKAVTTLRVIWPFVGRLSQVRMVKGIRFRSPPAISVSASRQSTSIDQKLDKLINPDTLAH